MGRSFILAGSAGFSKRSARRFAVAMPEPTTAQPSDPRIGIVMRRGHPVYYAYPNGYDAPAFEGSLAAVAQALACAA